MFVKTADNSRKKYVRDLRMHLNTCTATQFFYPKMALKKSFANFYSTFAYNRSVFYSTFANKVLFLQ